MNYRILQTMDVAEEYSNHYNMTLYALAEWHFNHCSESIVQQSWLCKSSLTYFARFYRCENIMTVGFEYVLEIR